MFTYTLVLLFTPSIPLAILEEKLSEISWIQKVQKVQSPK